MSIAIQDQGFDQTSYILIVLENDICTPFLQIQDMHHCMSSDIASLLQHSIGWKITY